MSRSNTKHLLTDIPEVIQREMYEELAPKFHRRSRATSSITKEMRLKTVAAVLDVISSLTIPQQRSVLQFTIKVLENAQSRWWRDQ